MRSVKEESEGEIVCGWLVSEAEKQKQKQNREKKMLACKRSWKGYRFSRMGHCASIHGVGPERPIEGVDYRRVSGHRCILVVRTSRTSSTTSSRKR